MPAANGDNSMAENQRSVTVDNKNFAEVGLSNAEDGLPDEEDELPDENIKNEIIHYWPYDLKRLKMMKETIEVDIIETCSWLTEGTWYHIKNFGIKSCIEI
jgi:hypothetical protein